MSFRDRHGTLQLRPPPPPPRRTSSSRDVSPDSGLSLSSTSSHPSTTSLEAASSTEHRRGESAPSSPVPIFSQQAHNDESQLLEDICSSLDSTTLSVLSLPEINSKVEKLRTNSVSLNDLKVKGVPKPAPKRPPVPVRRESLRQERKSLNSAKFYIPLRFSFHSEDMFPLPPPFTNCEKTYPTKTLFGIKSPVPVYKQNDVEDLKVEPPSNTTRKTTPGSRKLDGGFLSKVFSSDPRSEPLRTSLSNARYEVL